MSNIYYETRKFQKKLFCWVQNELTESSPTSFFLDAWSLPPDSALTFLSHILFTSCKVVALHTTTVSATLWYAYTHTWILPLLREKSDNQLRTQVQFIHLEIIVSAESSSSATFQIVATWDASCEDRVCVSVCMCVCVFDLSWWFVDKSRGRRYRKLGTEGLTHSWEFRPHTQHYSSTVCTSICLVCAPKMQPTLWRILIMRLWSSNILVHMQFAKVSNDFNGNRYPKKLCWSFA